MDLMARLDADSHRADSRFNTSQGDKVGGDE
jgi:hypothetical protein